jgi:DNA-binding MarR family transcriptional regulator
MRVHGLLMQICCLQILPALATLARVSHPVRSDVLAEAWREVLGVHARVSGALEHALQDGHGLGVSEFEVLEQLATHPDEGCRMHDLSASTHLSQSALSRVIGRLEKDGLVERAMCTTDRRGIFAALTPEGRKRWKAARPTHRAVLEELLGAAPLAGARG